MFARFIEAVPDAVVVVDAASTIRFVNSAAAELFGRPRDGLIGQSLTVLLPREAASDHAANVKRFFGAPGRRTMSGRPNLSARRGDGSSFPIEVALNPLELDGEHLTVATIRDVTEQRRAGREARINEERIRTLMELASVGTWELDLATDQRTYSPELLAMLGGSAPHGSSLDFFAAVHPDDVSAVRAATEKAVRERSQYHLALRVKRVDGDWRWFETRAFVESDEHGKPQRIRGLVMDVTDERRMAEQLVVADRLTQMGLLAAGVAHEINNPLAALLMSLELAQEQLTRERTGGLASQDLREAAEAAHRIRDIVSDLRLFARAEEARLAPVDVHASIETALRLARHELRNRAVVVTLWAPVPPVLATQGRLVQVFLNLLLNAGQALPKGVPDAHRITVSTSLDPAGRVAVDVRDTGSGMTPDTIAKLFTPFFTTKPAGVGSGLGLAICHRIVTGFGGELQVTSAPGEGSTFRVLLPAAPRRTQARLLVVGADAPHDATGFGPELEVVHCYTAQEAIDRIRSGERFELILCEARADLFESVEGYAPGQAERMIFFTGARPAESERELLARVRNARLVMPQSPEQLRSLLEAQLQRLGMLTR